MEVPTGMGRFTPQSLFAPGLKSPSRETLDAGDEVRRIEQQTDQELRAGLDGRFGYEWVFSASRDEFRQSH